MKQQTPPTSTEYLNEKWKIDWVEGGGDLPIWNEKECVATVWLQSNTSEVAKLIAAAPQLAKALQDIVNDWIGEGSFKSEPEYKTHNDKTVKDFGYWSPAGKQVKAELIAKAQSILKQAGLTE